MCSRRRAPICSSAVELEHSAQLSSRLGVLALALSAAAGCATTAVADIAAEAAVATATAATALASAAMAWLALACSALRAARACSSSRVSSARSRVISVNWRTSPGSSRLACSAVPSISAARSSATVRRAWSDST